MAGPCDWNIDISQCCEDTGEIDETVIEGAISRASEMLNRLSGFTIGECVAVLRPLANCKECRAWCCGGADGIRLMAKDWLPVQSVTQVRIGAEIVAPSTYHFDVETQMLWRTPGNKWPKSDDRWAAVGTEGAFVVDAVVGSEPDSWALDVATLLACELAKSCLGRKCRIPANATTVSSQGITITLSDLEIQGLLPEVAGWVKSVNPYKAKLPARMVSSDLAPSFRGGCCGR